MKPRFSADSGRQILARLLRGGRLHQLPTRQTDLELLLAIVANEFTPNRGYAEQEVNHLLKNWLPTVLADYAVDHVTVRRYLVDYGLLRRDPAGSRYQLGNRELDEWLSPDARRLNPAELLAALQAERNARRQQHELARRNKEQRS